MRIDILTLFPEMFSGLLSGSIIGKAIERGIIEVNVLNFREFSDDKHRTVDDAPYGGGGGMVLKPQPLFSAVEHILSERQPLHKSSPRIILLTPQGKPYRQQLAEEFAEEEHLILICGHYEGFDERIRQHLATDEVSIGDYVLTGGEIPAMVIVDSVSRLIPGVLGNERSAKMDSFSDGLLEHPHYTRPANFRGWTVPEVLLSGNHAEIDAWRRRESLRRTWERRPDLLKDKKLTDDEEQFLRNLEKK